MAVTVTEASWQTTVCDLAALLGWRVNHHRPGMNRRGHWETATTTPGMPDLTLWHEGQQRLLFAELKTDRGRLTVAQTDVIVSLRRAGCDAHVWRPRDFDAVRACLRGDT